MTKQNPITLELEGIGKVIKVSDVGEEFAEWLNGQTRPVVESEVDPYDWAFYGDYERFIKSLPVID